MTTDTSHGDTMLHDTMLSDRLERAGRHIEVPRGPGPGAIRERAWRRTRRNRAARAAAAVAFVAIGGAALANAVTGPSDHVATDVHADDYRRPTAAELNGGLPPDEAEPLVWQSIEAADLGDLSSGASPVWTGERFLLPTWVQGGRTVLLTSPDGEAWEASPALDGWISSVAEVDDTVWAVDSGPAEVFRLGPGASEWEAVELPPSNDPRFAEAISSTGTVVAGSSGEVWFVIHAYPDGVHDFLVQQGYLSHHQGYGWSLDGDIIEVQLYDDGSAGELLKISVTEIEDALNGSGSTLRVLRLADPSGTIEDLAIVEGGASGGVLADGDGLLLAGRDGSWDPLSADDGAPSVVWRVDDDGVEVVDTFSHEADAVLTSGLGRQWVLANDWASESGASLNELGQLTGERLPYVQSLVGGDDVLVATGWSYDPDRSFIESGVDLFNEVFGRNTGYLSRLAAVSTDGERWSWQTTEEIFGAPIDQATFAVGDGRILAVGWNHADDELIVAVADLDEP